MEYIFKALLILIIELNIYYMLGYTMGKMKIFPAITSIASRFICGFIGYHFLFWCLAFPQMMMNGTLDKLSITWFFVMGSIISIIIIRSYKDLWKSYKYFVKRCFELKWYLIFGVMLTLFMVYFVCVNGQTDIDARGYIGEVTSIVDTNQLTGILISNGQKLDSIAFKRAFAMFGINSAVLCDIFDIHPLIFCRTVRAAMNIILFAIVTFEILTWVFRNYKDRFEHAIIVLMLNESFLFLFTNSIYSSSSFMLYRTYEGKAYCSGVLVLLAIFMALKTCTTNNAKWFGMIFITMITAMSISATATFVPPLIVGSIVFAYILVERKWKYVWMLAVSLSPNIIYIVLSITGFAGFQLEG